MKTLFKFLELAALTGAALFLQNLANEYALMERGYEAMGGEIFVFPFVMIIGGYLLGFFRNDRDYDDEEDCEDDEYEDNESDIIRFDPRNH